MDVTSREKRDAKGDFVLSIFHLTSRKNNTLQSQKSYDFYNANY